MFRTAFKSRWIATAFEFYYKTNLKKILSEHKFNDYKKWRPVEIPALLAFSWTFKKSDPEQAPQENVKVNIKNELKEADQLFDNGQFNECFETLSNLDSQYKNDVEILWRLSRALYQMASKPDISGNNKKQLANDAFKTISEAMKINDNHFAVHKWMSVILDLKAACDGTTERVKNLEVVKNHMLRAVEINPGDATTLYMLGEWCYRIADMPWYQRKIAKTLFAEPPTSSYEEAISYFMRAERVEPNFYSMNLLMLGKSYMKLEKIDAAKHYLNMALHYPARTNDDHQANKEAQDILKNMK